MITYSVFYPQKEDAFFDFDYYQNKHLGILKKHFGDACKGIIVLKNRQSNSAQSEFKCICHIFIETEEKFSKIMEKARPELLADVKNYTDIKPYSRIFDVSMHE